MAKQVDLNPNSGNNEAITGPNISAPSLVSSQVTGNGLTAEEAQHPNEIKVEIADPSPVIILFGARSSGKTMTLIRLTRWLNKNGYKVEPVRTFRPSNSARYLEMCNSFNDMVNSDNAVASTAALNFMLVSVMNKYGEPICQLLEAPGEHYFDIAHPNAPFPRYINEIRAINNPKTWVFIVEHNWKDRQDRLNYATKIIKMQSQIEPKDRVIFTCHKADLHPALFSNGKSNDTQFFKNIQNQYEGIFSKYMNQNPVTRLWRKYNFDFIVFSAGFFNEILDPSDHKIGESYVQSNDKYPGKLWQSILKTVKGSW